MVKTDFEIYNYSGQLIYKNVFTGNEYKMSLNLNPGLYFVKYKNSQGLIKYSKFVKL